ncbi:superoxide dismutase family protein [Paenibacillus validus]|uniref:superoxide dismutase family protein n=1 Tax=Paenibacillus validus TaxID=44253 RepID=UPI003D2C0593
MNKSMLGLCIAVVTMLIASGCERLSVPWIGADAKARHGHETQQPDDSTAVMAKEAKPVSINMIGTKGTPVGTATLTQTAEGLRIRLEASGLTPGEHGFHVHETGACAAPDFTTAGGHFNPDGHAHGLESSSGPHAGDLPNLVADQQGVVKAEVVAKSLTLEKDKPNSVSKAGGTALIIHEKADDNKTGPSGNAGARVACGVISAG